MAQLNWPLPDSLDDVQLESQLYPPKEKTTSVEQRVVDCLYIHQQLKRKSVTLMLLWQEYKEKFPKGFGYSRYCEIYRKWQGELDICMRQNHKAGEKCFVDYAGMKISVVNQTTGEIREAEIFVATLGASNFTFAEATWSQQLPDWIASHVRAFEFFGGVPEIVVPDNLKSGVTKAHRYEPDVNPTYQDMAQHNKVLLIYYQCDYEIKITYHP